MTSKIDYLGARASNAGDQFHELWALEKILKLLDKTNGLTAVGVEGVKSENISTYENSSLWEGVDVVEYFGGDSLQTANHIEFSQLKYSSANPEISWTVARLVSNSAKTGNNSVIRRMATSFKDAKREMTAGATLKIKLVSNQPLSVELTDCLEARWIGDIDKSHLEKNTIIKIKSLQTSSGLSPTEFRYFLDTLDFSNCGHSSRQALKEKLIRTLAELLNEGSAADARELQMKVREYMLPERTGEVIRLPEILSWFGLGSIEGLFPCPPDLQPILIAVPRTPAKKVLELLQMGQRCILVHGAGGCGKTTMMKEISTGLPGDSVSVVFDCFGGGRYVYTDDKRHLPENAFLQLTNEVSLALKLPLFIPHNSKNTVDVRTFTTKLKLAGETLKKINPSSLLVITIDAADNSLTASSTPNPPEKCFVLDLINANLSDLPDNVRILISSRTSRKDFILPSHGFVDVQCPPFDITETTHYLTLAGFDFSQSEIEQFHALSLGNPRVQSYAIKAASGDSNTLLESLRPNGKSLSDILKNTFELALKKHGQSPLFDKLLAALAFLPAPATIESVAAVAGSTDTVVHDLLLDLSPGLKLQNGAISVADEDIEGYVKDISSSKKDETTQIIAEYFLKTHQTNAYSSLHLADALITVNRSKELLQIIEKEPNSNCITDPILRRQIQIRRLRLSLSACQHTGSQKDALKTILISAEAEKDENTIREILEKEIDLSIEFSSANIRRSILLDPERASEQGRFLVFDALRAARLGDKITTREQLHYYDAWLNKRKSITEEHKMRDWTVEDIDIAARCEAILLIAGAEAAFKDLMRWQPRSTPFRVGVILIPQLIKSGKSQILKDLLTKKIIPKPWDLVLFNALEMSGERTDSTSLEKSLKKIKRSHLPDTNRIDRTPRGEDWEQSLLDTITLSCEIAYQKGLSSTIILECLDNVLDTFKTTKAKLYGFNFNKADILIRCWLLRAKLSNSEIGIQKFISFLSAEILPPADPKETEKRRRADTDDFESCAAAVFPIYLARLEIFNCALENKEIQQTTFTELGEVSDRFYSFNYRHDSRDWRKKAALSVANLLFVPQLQVSDLLTQATKLSIGKNGDLFGYARLPLWEIFSLRLDQITSILEKVTKTLDDIKDSFESGSEKYSAVVSLARLLLPISRTDAEALFTNAISIAKEIDQEAMDQIDFLSKASLYSKFESQDEKRKTASNIYSFTSGASTRLVGRDFSWDSSIRTLTRLDFSYALAAISQWADEGTAELYLTIDTFINTSLEEGHIDLQTATALLLLTEEHNSSVRKEIIERTKTAPIQEGKLILDELAKDVLLLFPQKHRKKMGDKIASHSDKLLGPWGRKLKNTISFIDSQVKLDLEESSSKNSYHSLEKKVFNYSTPFASTDSLEAILKENRDAPPPRYDYEFLTAAKNASSAPPDRVAFLNAVAGLSEDLIWGNYKVRLIHETLEEWSGTPSIEIWKKETLPQVILENFEAFAMYLKQGQSLLPKVLKMIDFDSQRYLTLLLHGTAKSGLNFNSRQLFGISELICEHIPPSELKELLVWYSQRLVNRLPEKERVRSTLSDVPLDLNDSIGRFLFSLMSDIDTRVRWRTAHCLRRLVKLNKANILNSTILQINRTEDSSFRDPTAPFYYLAAKLWLLMSLYRISSENPLFLAPYKPVFLEIAASVTFPHIAIREYSKRILLELDKSKVISLTTSEKKALIKVNAPTKTIVKNKNNSPLKSFRNLSFEHGKKQRFSYNSMDTLPYWYEPIPRFFPEVTQEQFLNIADRWIIDEWNGKSDTSWWDKEPRKGRYDERKSHLWSHDHGSFPKIERHSSYLEWHAMHCIVGELLKTNAVFKPEYELEGLNYWISKFLPSTPPNWISDSRVATPLRTDFWIDSSQTNLAWLKETDDNDFVSEIKTSELQKEGWIVVAGSFTVHYKNKQIYTNISSALVTPDTATSLMRALQTASDPWDYRLPDENDRDEIDNFPHRLIGWLGRPSNDGMFDTADPLRYQTSTTNCVPGKDLIDYFSLSKTGSEPIWFSKNTGEIAFTYESWCDEPEKDRDYEPDNRTDGWRLWAKADFVKEFLVNKKMDLIFEVQIERRIEEGYGSEKTNKSKKKDKILLFKGKGIIQDYSDECIGTW